LRMRLKVQLTSQIFGQDFTVDYSLILAQESNGRAG